MPLAPSTRLPPTKVFSIIMTAINSGLGCHSQFCCSGSTIGASGENVSPPTTDLQKGQKWSGVSVGKHQFFPFFFVNEPIADTLRHAYTKFRVNIEDVTP